MAEPVRQAPQPGRLASLLRESRLTLGLGLPVIAAQLIQMSMNFVDTVMAGQYAAEDLAAVAVGFSLFSPVFTLGSGTLMAINPIVAQHFGARRFEQIGLNVRQSLWLSLLVALPCFFGLRHMEPVMILMDIEPQVRLIATGYLSAISWGIFPAFVFMTLRYFNEGLGATRPAMYISLIGLGFNILGNYTLIYGHFGFPELGGVGTGWASTLVLWTMCITMVIYTAGKKNYRRFRIFAGLGWPDRRTMGEILRLGLPIGFSATMEVTMFALTALLMASLGSTAVAAHQIAINVAAMTFMIPFGLSTAITVRVGHNLGKGYLQRARFSGLVGVGLCVIIMTCTAILMFLFPHTITGIYTGDAEVRSIAVGLIYMAAIFQISDGLQVSGYGALRGLKDTRVPMLVNLFAYWIIGIPGGYLMGFVLDIGPTGLWMGLIAGLTVAAVLHNLRFLKLTRRR